MKQKVINKNFTIDKNYYTYNHFLRQKFGTKVFKIPVNLDFTCPNRDGKLGVGGCAFCSASGSGDFAGNPKDELKKQFDEIKNRMQQKWGDENYKYLVYFQANTNTYTDVKTLKSYVEAALKLDPKVVGIAISTRPDCLEDEIVEYLGEVNKKTFLQVELGLQSVYNETLEKINRGHTLETYIDTVNRLKKHDIEVVTHIINGLPGETTDMMLATVRKVVEIGCAGIKIHLLHVIKNTVLAYWYEENKFKTFDLEDYVELVVKQLEIIPDAIVIHRLTGDGKKEDLIAPLWSLKKFVVLNEIDKLMRKQETYQGRLAKVE